MNSVRQSEFFKNLDDYVIHLRWLFIISDGNSVSQEDIVQLSVSLCKQIGLAELCTEKDKENFTNNCIYEFSTYEQYITKKQRCFVLSDYLNPKGQPLNDIRETTSRYQSKEDKERYLMSWIVQMKDASNLLFKIGESSFYLFRGENNTVVEVEIKMTVESNGMMLINNPTIKSDTKNAMYFLHQVISAFSVMLDVICLGNGINYDVLQEISGVVLPKRDKEEIAKLVGSIELANYYLTQLSPVNISTSQPYKGIAKDLKKYIANTSDDVIAHIINYHNLPDDEERIKWVGKKTDASRFCDWFNIKTSEWNKCFVLNDGKPLNDNNKNRTATYMEGDGKGIIPEVLSKYPQQNQ